MRKSCTRSFAIASIDLETETPRHAEAGGHEGVFDDLVVMGLAE